ncbi:extracellular solute-binding protein [Cohnella sp. CBP 2801]|uniref:Extracellular solute-binding protein n=2 Tax=Cohnella zeiphila TaxID=2761120 RepID=A0A7X0VSW1_9BACL|nr:extracellular solute-binding protein [Cohnella zeiphila]
MGGCSGSGSSGEDKLKPLGKDEQATIKVMFYDESAFFQEYGSLFISKFPNIDVQVVNMQTLYNTGVYTEDSIYKFIDQQKPDVLMLSPDQYEKMATDGKLYELDSVIKQDKFDTEGIQPAILKLLRDKGNGTLYGLSPSFSNSALFYNKDLFEKYGIEPPTDSMSWDEILTLAERFPTDGSDKDRIYGFGVQNYGSIIDMAYQIGSTNGLRVLSPDGSQVTMNTDAWKQVFQTVAKAAASKAIRLPSNNMANGSMTMEEYYNRDPFISGKTAMYVGYSYDVQNIKQAKSSMPDKKLNWGIVTAPVDPNNRGQSNSFSLSNVFAVNAQSPNLRAAWEFVKYIDSEDFARVKSKSSNSGNLLSRTAYNPDVDGVSLEPFYKLEPVSDPVYSLDKAPASFYGLFMPILQDELQAVIDGKKTLDEASADIQSRAQEALVKAKKQDEEAKAKQQASAASADVSSGSAAASASASASATDEP